MFRRGKFDALFFDTMWKSAAAGLSPCERLRRFVARASPGVFGWHVYTASCLQPGDLDQVIEEAAEVLAPEQLHAFLFAAYAGEPGVDHRYLCHVTVFNVALFCILTDWCGCLRTRFKLQERLAQEYRGRVTLDDIEHAFVQQPNGFMHVLVERAALDDPEGVARLLITLYDWSGPSDIEWTRRLLRGAVGEAVVRVGETRGRVVPPLWTDEDYATETLQMPPPGLPRLAYHSVVSSGVDVFYTGMDKQCTKNEVTEFYAVLVTDGKCKFTVSQHLIDRCNPNGVDTFKTNETVLTAEQLAQLHAKDPTQGRLEAYRLLRGVPPPPELQAEARAVRKATDADVCPDAQGLILSYLSVHAL